MNFGSRSFGRLKIMKINSWRDLEVYQSAFGLQQRIFELSKAWPSEEKYSLTDQIRRSSRSIGANIAEAWAKRRYPAHFLSKLTDSDGELQETLHWLESSKACGYVAPNEADELVQLASHVGRQLGSMINRHESFCF
jgi:four helix bundle protein